MDIREELATNRGPTPNSNPLPPKTPLTPPPNPPGDNPPPPDQTDDQGDNNQSPEPDQPAKNNPPTNGDSPTPSPVDNPARNDDSDKENNDDSPSPNSDNPEPLEPINIGRINNAETLEKAQQIAQQQIQKLFLKSKVKSSELDKSLWKNKSSWEEFLKELKTSQEIAEFSQLLEGKIKEKQKKKAIKTLNNKSNPSNKMLILALGGGTFLVIFIIAFIIKTRHKRRKKIT